MDKLKSMFSGSKEPEETTPTTTSNSGQSTGEGSHLSSSRMPGSFDNDVQNEATKGTGISSAIGSSGSTPSVRDDDNQLAGHAARTAYHPTTSSASTGAPVEATGPTAHTSTHNTSSTAAPFESSALSGSSLSSNNHGLGSTSNQFSSGSQGTAAASNPLSSTHGATSSSTPLTSTHGTTSSSNPLTTATHGSAAPTGAYDGTTGSAPRLPDVSPSAREPAFTSASVGGLTGASTGLGSNTNDASSTTSIKSGVPGNTTANSSTLTGSSYPDRSTTTSGSIGTAHHSGTADRIDPHVQSGTYVASDTAGLSSARGQDPPISSSSATSYPQSGTTVSQPFRSDPVSTAPLGASSHNIGSHATTTGSAGTSTVGSAHGATDPHALSSTTHSTSHPSTTTSTMGTTGPLSSTTHSTSQPTTGNTTGNTGTTSSSYGSGLSHGQGENVSSYTGPASSTTGPHTSNLANVMDPRVRPEPEKMKEHTTVGPHQSDTLNKLDPKVTADPHKAAEKEQHHGQATTAAGAGVGAGTAYEADKRGAHHTGHHTAGESSHTSGTHTDERRESTLSRNLGFLPKEQGSKYHDTTNPQHTARDEYYGTHEGSTGSHAGRNVAAGTAAGAGAGALGTAVSGHEHASSSTPTHNTSSGAGGVTSSSANAPSQYGDNYNHLSSGTPSGVSPRDAFSSNNQSTAQSGSIDDHSKLGNTSSSSDTAGTSNSNTARSTGDHHYGRDAAIGAGTAAAGTGIYDASRQREVGQAPSAGGPGSTSTIDPTSLSSATRTGQGISSTYPAESTGATSSYPSGTSGTTSAPSHYAPSYESPASHTGASQEYGRGQGTTSGYTSSQPHGASSSTAREIAPGSVGTSSTKTSGAVPAALAGAGTAGAAGAAYEHGRGHATPSDNYTSTTHGTPSNLSRDIAPGSTGASSTGTSGVTPGHTSSSTAPSTEKTSGSGGYGDKYNTLSDGTPSGIAPHDASTNPSGTSTGTSSGHHYGRDAAVATAGGAGLAGAGVYNAHGHQGSEGLPSGTTQGSQGLSSGTSHSTTGPLSGPTTSSSATHGDQYSRLSDGTPSGTAASDPSHTHTGVTSTTPTGATTSSGHHHGRDAAVVGGTGLAGAGAYNALEHGTSRGLTSGQTSSATYGDQYGRLGDGTPSSIATSDPAHPSHGTMGSSTTRSSAVPAGVATGALASGSHGSNTESRVPSSHVPGHVSKPTGVIPAPGADGYSEYAGPKDAFSDDVSSRHLNRKSTDPNLPILTPSQATTVPPAPAHGHHTHAPTETSHPTYAAPTSTTHGTTSSEPTVHDYGRNAPVTGGTGVASSSAAHEGPEHEEKKHRGLSALFHRDHPNKLHKEPKESRKSLDKSEIPRTTHEAYGSAPGSDATGA